MNFKNLLAYSGIFLTIFGGSYYAFSKLTALTSGTLPGTTPKAPLATPTKKATGFLVFEGPKTEVCPLNGQLFTAKEKEIWSQRRPLTVMIENHADSRPQSGLQNADIVYEAVSEGGITRFMGVFYCNAVRGAESKYDLGPVRSARTYFVNLASEYADYPLHAHVGGSNCSAPKDPVTGVQSGPCTTNSKVQAIEQIANYGWNNKGTWGDLSQFSLSYKVCRREPERTGELRDTEHSMYCSSTELWNVAADRGLTNMTVANKVSWDKNFRPWAFNQKDASLLSDGQTGNLSFDFWSGYKDYAVTWKYNKSANLYTRFHGEAAHTDFNTGEAITSKNIVIQFVKETRSLDSHGHNFYEVIGTGKGMLFQNGTKTDITWSKANRVSRTIFKDNAGKEIQFVPGQIWIEVLPLSNTVTYENI